MKALCVFFVGSCAKFLAKQTLWCYVHMIGSSLVNSICSREANVKYLVNSNKFNKLRQLDAIRGLWQVIILRL